jgi:hypothetical protein
MVSLSLEGSSDPDGDSLSFDWIHYPHAGSYAGSVDIQVSGEGAEISIPTDAAGEQIHVVIAVRDDGTPSLTRYRRVVLDVAP